MTFEEFERKKTKDDYGHHHNPNHAYLGELFEALNDSDVEELVLSIRSYVRGDEPFGITEMYIKQPIKKAADLKKESLTQDYENDWSYPDEAA